MIRLLLALLLVSCVNHQADESVVSASEYSASIRGEATKYIVATQEITEDSFVLVRQACMTFCISSEVSCTCKCNTGLNKLREASYSQGLKYISQWDKSLLDHVSLSQKEKEDCESFN